MDTATRSPVRYATRLIVVIASGLIITGCAEIGGKQLSLLTSSEILDPLEVPPGMTPLPEAEQFAVPGDYEPEELNPEDLSPEQFRNYATWVEFEQFQQFKAQDQGEGIEPNEFRAALAEGRGQFRARVVKAGDATRLRVVDSASGLWPRLQPVLRDMGVKVSVLNEEERTLRVSNIEIKELPTFTQRIGFKEYRGRIDEIHLSTVSPTETEVVAKTEFNIEVDATASRDFMTRLRFFLLSNYEEVAPGVVQVASTAQTKWLTHDNEGVQTIVLAENFDSAWVRVGRTLEASGVNIDDQNRSEGVYYVSYTSLEKKKKRFRLAFWRKDEKEIAVKEFKVLVTGAGSDTTVKVQGGGETEEDQVSADQLLGIIYERLAT